MKEFLEKRWWGGVSVIIALLLGIPALIQYFGEVNISWLAVTIALNAILAIALILVAVWNARLKHKYENISGRLEEIKEFVEKQMKTMKQQRVLLSDPDYIWKLNIDNTLLTQLHGQAHGLAMIEFEDAKLSRLGIIVNPYQAHDRVSILFTFYSKWADRVCTCIVTEVRNMNKSVPSHPATDELDRVTFDEPPWLRDPNWPQFVRKACEKAGPLSRADWTGYHVSAMAWNEPPWDISIKDGATGREVDFSWDGKGDPIPIKMT